MPLSSMSSSNNPLLAPPAASPPSCAPIEPVQTLPRSSGDPPRIIFTRQLWQRTMPNGDDGEQVVLDRSQTANSQAIQNNAAPPSRRASSTTSLRSARHRSTNLSSGSQTPLTPEESPPFGTRRKRSAGVSEQGDHLLKSPEISPAHTRTSSGESGAHLCLCQPEPKPPRPRNAFILYRQHHQGSVVAQNPGLSNPDISKIIGAQWRSEASEQKDKWKALAEEEKLRHQQQYPGYRYQPKRAGRRGSVDVSASASDKPNCQTCGGRTILTPSAPYHAGNSSIPSTPANTTTPVTRTLPVFRELTLDSPAHRRSLGRSPLTTAMPLSYRDTAEERDDVGPLSPGPKRRKIDIDTRSANHRPIQAQYGAPPLSAIGPGTPFPHAVNAHGHPFTTTAMPVRRESLPSIRGVATSPQVSMPPPPRPGMGYQQHRLSQGHAAHDRTLVLPPLQTGRSASTSAAPPGSGKSIDEQMKDMSFRYKIKVLSQVAPPAFKSKSSPRGPFIAVEGDDAQAVKKLAVWLADSLAKDEHSAVELFEGPVMVVGEDREESMAMYHDLSAKWIRKGKSIFHSLSMHSASTENSTNDALATTSLAEATPIRKLDEDYNIDDANISTTSPPETTTNPHSSSPKPTPTKPIAVIPNYSLHTANHFSHTIPIGPTEFYNAYDHWQWTATVWRGTLGPDLTVYLRDVAVGATGGASNGSNNSVELEGVEGRPGVGLFVVRRVVEGDRGEVEASVLRRVGFEVGEWVREFGGEKEREKE